MTAPDHPPLAPWRQKLHTVIFEADTPGGKAFDVALLIAIVITLDLAAVGIRSRLRRRFGAGRI